MTNRGHEYEYTQIEFKMRRQYKGDCVCLRIARDTNRLPDLRTQYISSLVSHLFVQCLIFYAGPFACLAWQKRTKQRNGTISQRRLSRPMLV